MASMHVPLHRQCVQLVRIDVSVGQDAYIELASMHVQLARIMHWLARKYVLVDLLNT